MNKKWFERPSVFFACSVLSFTAVSHAQSPSGAGNEGDARMQQLRQQVGEQARQIEALRQAVAEQEARQRELQRLLGPEPRSVAGQPASASQLPDTARRDIQVGSAPPQEL